MTESQQARRELTGNMPTGENRLAGREYVVEDRPNALDYEQDAWVPFPATEAELFQLLQGWARK